MARRTLETATPADVAELLAALDDLYRYWGLSYEKPTREEQDPARKILAKFGRD